MFKLDKDDKIILVDITINFNNKLTSTRAPQRPFFMQLPLNFKTKQQLESFTIFFDAEKVKEVIKVEDHMKKHLNLPEFYNTRLWKKMRLKGKP